MDNCYILFSPTHLHRHDQNIFHSSRYQCQQDNQLFHFKESLVQEQDVNTWSLAKGEREGFPILYRYRSRIDSSIKQSDYPTMVVISWSFDASINGGFPDEATNDRQQLLEDLLNWLDTPTDSLLTQVITCNGTKEWLWYVKDCDEWMDKLNQSLSGQPEFPIEINFYNEPEWDTYNGFINWLG